VLKTAFYFIRSATTGFTVSVSPFRSRVSLKEAFAGLELGEGKLSRPVLRGPGGRKAVWLLGNNPQSKPGKGSGNAPAALQVRKRRKFFESQPDETPESDLRTDRPLYPQSGCEQHHPATALPKNLLSLYAACQVTKPRTTIVTPPSLT
jgi:hypothetical protein